MDERENKPLTYSIFVSVISEIYHCIYLFINYTEELVITERNINLSPLQETITVQNVLVVAIFILSHY